MVSGGLPAFRVLVCGGRDFDNREFLYRTLDATHRVRPITLIIHGAAHGADRMSGDWARKNGIAVAEYPADWKRYPKAAGPIRNRQMLAESYPDLVIAMPGGTGTADMVKISCAAKVKVMEFDHNLKLVVPKRKLEKPPVIEFI